MFFFFGLKLKEKNPYEKFRNMNYEDKDFTEWNPDVLKNIIIGYLPNIEHVIMSMFNEEFIEWFFYVIVKNVYRGTMLSVDTNMIMSDIQNRFGRNFISYCNEIKKLLENPYFINYLNNLKRKNELMRLAAYRHSMF